MVIIDWLMRDEQQELFEIMVAIVLNIIFLALSTLLLWLLGQGGMVWSLAQGYGRFWLIVIALFFSAYVIQRFFRIDMYSHYNVFVSMNLIISSVLAIGWAAFVAFTAGSFAANTSIALATVLYAVGFVSSYVGAVIVTAFYYGQIYRLLATLLALLSFIVFAVWPSLARALFG